MTVATAVQFDDKGFIVSLADGRELRVPLTWFPRLLSATPAQRATVRITRSGLHWDGLDEDISVDGLLRGIGELSQTSAYIRACLSLPPTFFYPPFSCIPHFRTAGNILVNEVS